MSLLNKKDLLVLKKFEFIKLNDHVLFELVSELLNLLPFVRVFIDIRKVSMVSKDRYWMIELTFERWSLIRYLLYTR